MHLPPRPSLRPHRHRGDRPPRRPLPALRRVPAAEGRSRAGSALLAELDVMAADVRAACPEPPPGPGRRHPRG